MNNKKQDTMADIVREMRRKEWYGSPLSTNSAYVQARVLDWSDRIEAAWGREREAIYAMLDNSINSQRRIEDGKW